MSDYKNLIAEAKVLNESLSEDKKIKLFGISNSDLEKAVAEAKNTLAKKTESVDVEDVEEAVKEANKTATNEITDPTEIEKLKATISQMKSDMENLQKPLNPVSTKSTVKVKPMSEKAKAVKELLDAEPKIGYNLPLEQGDKVGEVRTVTINGYRLNLRKGHYYDALPVSVVEILKRRDQTSTEQGFGQDLRIGADKDRQNALS